MVIGDAISHCKKKERTRETHTKLAFSMKNNLFIPLMIIVSNQTCVSGPNVAATKWSSDQVIQSIDRSRATMMTTTFCLSPFLLHTHTHTYYTRQCPWTYKFLSCHNYTYYYIVIYIWLIQKHTHTHTHKYWWTVFCSYALLFSVSHLTSIYDMLCTKTLQLHYMLCMTAWSVHASLCVLVASW